MKDLKELYPMTRSAQRLLVIDPGQLGDTVHLVPALWELRRGYPNAEIHVISSPVGAEVLRMADCADFQWILDQAPERRRLFAQLQVLFALRRKQFDLSFNFGDNDRNVIHAAIAGARRRLAPRRDRWHFWSQWCVPIWVSITNRDEPVFEQRRQMLAACGIELGAPRFDLRPPQSALDWAAANVPEGAIHLSINASAFWKEWPLEKWIESSERLMAQGPTIQLVATSSSAPRELERLNELAGAIRSPRLKAFPGPTVAQLCAGLSRCDLHIGADSGVVHLAMALGLPTVSIFRRYPGLAEWLPRGPEHRHFVTNCACLHGIRPECRSTQRAVCLTGISAEDVAHAALAVRRLR
jgi:ADP-heptose:LPS heptosyltransferase